MTTGRINQVTIVRRLGPTARVSGRKSSLGYWEAGARPAWPHRWSGCAPGLQRVTSAFPSWIPQSAVGGRERGAIAPRSRRLSAPRGGPTGRFSRAASPTGRYPRWLWRGLANRQSPTEPTPRRTRGIPLRLQSLPRCRAAPGQSQGSRGAGAVLAEIVGAPADRRAPRESGDVWNGTDNSLRRPPWRGAKAEPRHPPHRSLFCSLLIYPPAGVQWGARPGGLLGGFPNPAKPNLYGFC